MRFATDFTTWQRIASFKATASTDPFRPILQAVSLTVKKGTLTVASTTSYVLSRTRLDVSDAANGQALVKASALARSVSHARAVARDHGFSDSKKSIAKIRDLRVRVDLSEDGKRVNVSFGDDGLLGVALPVIDAKFPEYEAMIPDVADMELGAQPVGVNPDVFRLLAGTAPQGAPLIMRCQDPLKPVVFTSPVDPEWIGLAMPVRMVSTAEVAA